jgi:hypothetical protein
VPAIWLLWPSLEVNRARRHGIAVRRLGELLRELFVVAGTALLFLFIGIHNAWDTVTYIALDHVQASDAPAERS